VIPAPFEYHRASSVDDAIAALGTTPDAKLLAGGHSLIPLLRLRFVRPSKLVDVGELDELRYVRADGDWIAIGALTRHSDLARDPILIEGCTLLADAAGQIGDPQVRHRGTIGGAVAHGDPVSDIPAILLALDAELVATGPGGARTIPASEFFEGVYQTALAPDEMLTELRVPALSAGRYLKFVRRAQDWATVGAAAVKVNGHVQVGLASMGATPLRARGVEEALAAGASPAEAAARTAEGTSPPSDVSGSAEYRAHIAQVLVRRALEQL
jgi:aerobic carbon-monoxide dehydrogenase medium subunit